MNTQKLKEKFWFNLLLLIGVLLIAVVGGTRVLFGVDPITSALWVTPPKVNLNTTPSEADCSPQKPTPSDIVDAIRNYGKRDSTPGVGEDGLVYIVDPISCPTIIGVATPKLTARLTISSEKGEVLNTGTLSLGTIDEPTNVIIFGYQPDSEPSSSELRAQPALAAFLSKY